jgi:hypothetical protein
MAAILSTLKGNIPLDLPPSLRERERERERERTSSIEEENHSKQRVDSSRETTPNGKHPTASLLTGLFAS